MPKLTNEQLISVVLIVVYSVILHEIAHGYVASLLGDPTAKQRGRLSLNPFVHIDLLWTIIIPALMLLTSGFAFGAAKPVPINPTYFKNVKRGMMLTAIAGPATNLIIAGVLALIFHSPLCQKGVVQPVIILYGIIINVFLAVFNLVPIPPLDGSRIVTGFLPRNLAISYNKLERFGFFIIIGLWHFNLLNVVIEPITIYLLGSVFQILN